MKALRQLQDGFAVAQELADFIHALGTKTADEAAMHRAAWERGEQGKRFLAALGVLPNEDNIHHDIGYALRVLMCDVALAHFHRHSSDLLELAKEYRNGNMEAVNTQLRIGIDSWEIEWSAKHRTFTSMTLIEPVTQPTGMEYMATLRISIPEELRV